MALLTLIPNLPGEVTRKKMLVPPRGLVFSLQEGPDNEGNIFAHEIRMLFLWDS
jgi:hypothetical protein